MTVPLPPVVAVAVCLALGVATGLLVGPLLRRLPARGPAAADADGTVSPARVSTPASSVDGPAGLGSSPTAPTRDAELTHPVDRDDDLSPDYAALATWRFALACGGVAAIASLLVVGLAPWPWLPLWLVWSTLFAVLVSVDAATTWLPLSLTRLAWAAGAAGVALHAVLAVAGGPATLGGVGRALLGAAVAGLIYGALWRFGKGLGFGDVRISPLLGALGATLSWGGWWVAMVAGPLLGALWGVARTATGRRGPYAYGPWMWLGPAAALVAQATGPFGA